MAWPYGTVTPIRQEMYINGGWVDVTDDTRGSNQDITITCGYSQEQAQLGAGSITFALNNRDGTYANRNPLSPYYGLLPRNVPHRCSVVLAETSLRLTDVTDLATGTYDGARAWTADKASLDITGDIDMRIDCEADDWLGRTGSILAAKYIATTNNRSWIFYVDPHGYPSFAWSPDGTNAARINVKATAPITGFGRQVLRVTLDVNNGAGGNTVAFYTGTAIAGTFTQIGSSVVTTGVTSIFSSSAPLEVGTANDGGDRLQFTSTINADPFCGKIYGYQLRSGIGGTIVAYMQANAKARGTTSWSDGLTSPNTWTLDESAEITDADYRFHSEIAELPSVWDPTGSDVYVSVTAMDVVERLTTGQKALNSPIYRHIVRSQEDDLDGYWPMEDGVSADRIGSYVGQQGFIVDGAFGTTTLGGSAGALTFTSDSGYASGGVVGAGGANGTAQHLWYFRMTTLTAGTVDFMNLYYIGGAVYRAVISCADTGSFTMVLQDNTYTNLASTTVGWGTGISPTNWIGMRLLLTQSGGTVNWALSWYQTGSTTLFGTSGSFSSTFGKPRSWISFPYTGKSNLQLAHVAISRNDLGFNGADFANATNGYVGETANGRARRLCYEEGVPFWWIGPDAIESVYQGVPMGVQTPQTLVALLQEIADTDGGILYSPRDKFGLAIRSFYSMINREGPALDYTAKHLSGQLIPRELRDFRNDVTATRTNGGSGRYVKPSGTNSTASVGTYAVTLPRNTAADIQLEPIAEREVMFGTWDELRQTRVQVELHRAALLADSALSAEVAALGIGQPFTIENLPDYAGGPDDAVLRVLGYTENLGNLTRTLTFNTAPYGMFQVGTWGDTSTPNRTRWGARYTTLGSSALAGATSLSFSISDQREVWSTTNVPYDVVISGERMTVTAMSGVSGSGPYTQTATVMRAVNGISKALPSGSTVRLWDAGRWGWRSNYGG